MTAPSYRRLVAGETSRVSAKSIVVRSAMSGCLRLISVMLTGSNLHSGSRRRDLTDRAGRGRRSSCSGAALSLAKRSLYRRYM